MRIKGLLITKKHFYILKILLLILIIQLLFVSIIPITSAASIHVTIYPSGNSGLLNDNEVLYAGEVQRIKWYFSGNIGNDLLIELCKDDGSTVSTIASTVYKEDEEYFWKISTDIQTNEFYRIKISSVSYGSIFDYSNLFYLKDERYIRITSPKQGYSWATGETHNIKWETKNVGGNSVKIELINLQSTGFTICSSAQNNGIYSWSIPEDILDGDYYKIKISSTAYNHVNCTSDVFIIINKIKKIVITNPTSNSIFFINEDEMITWESKFIEGTVTIDLYENDIFKNTIAQSIECNGVYDWKMNSDMNTESTYTLRINSDIDNLGFFSNSFSIKQRSINITNCFSPIDLDGGKGVNIYWDDAFAGSAVRIDLYKEDIFYKEISQFTDNDGIFFWTFDDDILPGDNFSIKITSNQYEYVYDTSSYFSMLQTTQFQSSISFTALLLFIILLLILIVEISFYQSKKKKRYDKKTESSLIDRYQKKVDFKNSQVSSSFNQSKNQISLDKKTTAENGKIHTLSSKEVEKEQDEFYWYDLAKKFKNNLQYQKAMDSIEKSLLINKNFSEAIKLKQILNSIIDREYKIKELIREANAYYNLKKYLNAFSSYSKIIELDSENDHAKNRLKVSFQELLLEITSLQKKQNYSDALDLVEKLLIYKPKDVTLKNLKKNLEKTVEEINRQKNDEQYWFEKALDAKEKKRYNSAISFLNKALKINEFYSEAIHEKNEINSIILSTKKLKRLITEGDKQFSTGNFEEALKNYNKALKENPNGSALLSKKEKIFIQLNRKIKLFDRNKKYQDALKLLNLILIEKPNDVNLIEYKNELQNKINQNDENYWYSEAKKQRRNNKFDEALKCLDKALAIKPNFKKSKEEKNNIKKIIQDNNKITQLLVEVDTLFVNENYSDALDVINKILKIDRDHKIARSKKDLILKQIKNYDDRSKYTEEYWYEKALEEEKKENYQKSLTYLDNALKINEFFSEAIHKKNEIKSILHDQDSKKSNTVDGGNWTSEIRNIILHKLNDDRFTLKDIYLYENELKKKFPDNMHIKDKIRQQLQVLRDEGSILFLGGGRYKIVKPDADTDSTINNDQEDLISSLEIGKVYSNDQIHEIFKCSPQGGMRRSHKTNSLVLISNQTGSVYSDFMVDGIFHYTGMGQSGNQDINFAQNKTLYESDENNVQVYLFVVFKDKKYTYFGEVRVVESPYVQKQRDESNQLRTVWMFPLKLTDNYASDLLDSSLKGYKKPNLEKLNFGINYDLKDDKGLNKNENRTPIIPFENDSAVQTIQLKSTDVVKRSNEKNCIIINDKITINCKYRNVLHPDYTIQKLIDSISKDDGKFLRDKYHADTKYDSKDFKESSGNNKEIIRYNKDLFIVKQDDKYIRLIDRKTGVIDRIYLVNKVILKSKDN